MRGLWQLAITIGLVTFTLVSVIMFTQFYSFRTTVQITEHTISDPSLPFLQALSYSTVADCGGKKVKYYDAMAALSLKSGLTTSICGQQLTLEPATNPNNPQYLLISKMYSTFLTNSTTDCYEYSLHGPYLFDNGERNKIVTYLLHKSSDYVSGTSPNCPAVLASLGGGAVGRKSTDYYFPLPPNPAVRKASISEHALTKFSGAP